MRLIDADKLEAYRTTIVPKNCITEYYLLGARDVFEYIDSMPTVEAIPIEWIALYIQEYPYNTASAMLNYWPLDQALERKALERKALKRKKYGENGTLVDIYDLINK